jgi:hypothetical protein
MPQNIRCHIQDCNQAAALYKSTALPLHQPAPCDDDDDEKIEENGRGVEGEKDERKERESLWGGKKAPHNDGLSLLLLRMSDYLWS